MNDLIFQILVNGTDPASSLQVAAYSAKTPDDQQFSTSYTQTLKDIKDLDAEQEALIARRTTAKERADFLAKVFSDVGITDLDAPMTDDAAQMIEQKNNEYLKQAISVRIAALQGQLASLGG